MFGDDFVMFPTSESLDSGAWSREPDPTLDSGLDPWHCNNIYTDVPVMSGDVPVMSGGSGDIW